MSNFRSRRNFLKTSLIGGSAAAVAGHLPLARAADNPAPVSAGNVTSRVSLAAGDDRANIAFKSLEPFRKEIAAAIGNRRVIIKPNDVIINKPACATSAENLEGILEFLHTIGKKNIVIAESPAGGSALEAFSNYGYDKFVGKYGVKLINLDNEDFSPLQCIDERDFQPHPCYFANIMLDPNSFIISAAMLKTHDLIGITLSLKNVVVGSAVKAESGGEMRNGAQPSPTSGIDSFDQSVYASERRAGGHPAHPAHRAHNGRRGGLSSNKRVIHGGGVHGINYNIYALSATLHPHLAVIDGYQGMEGTGPVNGTPVNQRVCIASMDWLAADRVGAELMGVDVSKIGYLTYCIRSGNRGQGDLHDIEIVGPSIKDYAKSYKLPEDWDQITSWQKPMTTC